MTAAPNNKMLVRRLVRERLLPDAIGAHFSDGQVAALSVVADVVRKEGKCELHLRQFADRAGVSPTTALDALNAARRLSLIEVEVTRPAVSRVRIVSPEWMEWLEWMEPRTGTALIDDAQKVRRLARTNDVLFPPADDVRTGFSDGERAALAILAEDALPIGSSELKKADIAALAGVSVTTVRNALRDAEYFGLIEVNHRRALPSRITIKPGWLEWLAIPSAMRRRIYDRKGLEETREQAT